MKKGSSVYMLKADAVEVRKRKKPTEYPLMLPRWQKDDPALLSQELFANPQVVPKGQSQQKPTDEPMTDPNLPLSQLPIKY